MNTALKIIQKEVEKFLQNNDIPDNISSKEIAESVLENRVYSEYNLNDKKLIFFRFYSPVIMREEVFLGSVLLNSFLNRQLIVTVEEYNLGKINLISNDLENYFYLWYTEKSINEIYNHLVKKVQNDISILFFETQDETKGIYGNFENLFTFSKSEFEPFPVYSIPEFLHKNLEKSVRFTLLKLIESDDFGKNYKTVCASLSFFYGQKAGGVGDTQSFPLFLFRLLDVYKILKKDDITISFNIENITKDEIKKRYDDPNTINFNGLKELLKKLIKIFGKSIDKDEKQWLMKALINDGKFLDFKNEEYIRMLISQTTIGHLSNLSEIKIKNEIPCRICGRRCAESRSSMIIYGAYCFSFHNQSIKSKDVKSERCCARCALLSYLIQKLLGNKAVKISGNKFPQVPEQFNIIFHYGNHSDSEIKLIAQKLRVVYKLINERKSLFEQIKECNEAIQKLKNKIKNERKNVNLTDEIGQIESEKEGLTQLISQNTNEIKSDFDFIENPDEEPVFDIIKYSQIDPEETENYIFGIGFGGYRLISFVLPQIKWRLKNKSHDFVQKRFNTNRVSILTLLSFLRKVCGCDGPYYFLTLPTLSEDTFSLNNFYVRNEKYEADEVINFYELLSFFSKKVTMRKGEIPFVKQILLAEEMSENPIVMLSKVMRNSGLIYGEKKLKYKRISHELDPVLGSYDTSEYIKIYQKLHNQMMKGE